MCVRTYGRTFETAFIKSTLSKSRLKKSKSFTYNFVFVAMSISFQGMKKYHCAELGACRKSAQVDPHLVYIH